MREQVLHMKLFKKKKGNKPKAITKNEKISLIYLILDDIKNDSDFNLEGRIDKVKELLKDIEVFDTTNIEKCNLSNEYIEELFYILNQPSKLMKKDEYKKVKKVWDKLE
jgi:hypothetical protein